MTNERKSIANQRGRREGFRVPPPNNSHAAPGTTARAKEGRDTRGPFRLTAPQAPRKLEFEPLGPGHSAESSTSEAGLATRVGPVAAVLMSMGCLRS
jgi:hypothetical protein